MMRAFSIPLYIKCRLCFWNYFFKSVPCWLRLYPHCIEKGSWGQKEDKVGIRKEKKLKEGFESYQIDEQEWNVAMF